MTMLENYVSYELKNAMKLLGIGIRYGEYDETTDAIMRATFKTLEILEKKFALQAAQSETKKAGVS